MPRQPQHQWTYPGGGHVLGVHRRRGDPDLVRDGVDRRARRLRARRPDVGGLRRLRPGRPLRRRRHRPGHHPAVPDRRPDQGLGLHRPAGLPARLLRAPGTTTCGSSPSTGRSRPSCGTCRPTPCPRRCGTTTGTARRSCIGDHLVEGGENSQFHIVKLNRSYSADGLAQVAPQLVFNAPGWDDQLLAELGDTDVSIENSVAISGNTAYFANSGGPRPGLGPQRGPPGPARAADVPLLDRRRHRRQRRGRRGRLPLRGLRVGAAQRPGHRGRPDHEARPPPPQPPAGLVDRRPGRRRRRRVGHARRSTGTS